VFFFSGNGYFYQKKIRAILILVPALVFAIIYLDIFEIVSHRLVNEVFDGLVFFSPEYLGYIDNSGQARILGELNYFVHVFKNSPLFGYGIDYNVLLSTYGVERQMALNGFVEIFIRWGVFGLGIFFIFIFFEKLIYKPKSNFVFFIFVALYLTSDGAVSKIEYWLPIALVLAFERLRSNFALVNK
jgi:hypothetical protein